MQTLRLFLEQMAGGALYPDHPLKKGEEWKVSMSSPPSKGFPFRSEGENVLRFVEGKTVNKIVVVPGRLVNIVVSG